MSRRAHISLRTKLASALLALGIIPYDDAKSMGESNFLSLWQFDHGILHGVEINNMYWNLTPRLIAEHRAKSRKDTSIVAKTKAIARSTAEAQVRMAAKAPGQSARPKSKWGGGRKLQSRNTFQRRKP